jgi:LmbE family N-acetylglucosaminyl deacetylase
VRFILGEILLEKRQLAIFLSPHFDDIPLSCGGMAARLSKAGARCIGLTVFTAPAPEGVLLSAFAQELHDRWERDSPDKRPVNEVRRDEESAAMRLLGLETTWLDLPDAVYRSSPSGEHYYANRDSLLGSKVAPDERRMLVPFISSEIARVTQEAGAKGRVRVFAPLGVGGHVDHKLVYMAARRLGPRYGVLYYEDYPYAAKEGALAARLGEIGLPMQGRLISISDLIGLKIAAIARYKSQVPMLFDGEDKMPAAVRAYAQSVAGPTGGLQYAERYWHIPSLYLIKT